MTEPGSSNDGTKEAQGAWAAGKPTRVYYVRVVEALTRPPTLTSLWASPASLGPFVPHVSVTHMVYFKPSTDSFLVELKSKDRRSSKQLEYINGSGTWLETGFVALEVEEERGGTVEDRVHRLSLAETSFKASMEVLAMQSQYFRNLTDNGIEEARQMAYSVEQLNDTVQLASYWTARESLTTKLETEAANQLAKWNLERATNANKKKGGANGADS